MPDTSGSFEPRTGQDLAGPPFSDVSVVVPARNEARTIGAVVTACLAYTADVIVVDGASSDGTAEIAAAAGARVVTDRGRGKGEAMRLAVRNVTRPIVVFVDADGSHIAEDIPKLVAPIRSGEADQVSASRLIGGSSELHGGFDEFFRLAGSAFITACINWRFGVRLSDSQNGFRAIRTELLRALDLRERHTTIEQEMILKTLRRGGRIVEVPSHERPRQHGVSHIQLWRIWPRYLYVLVRGLL